MQELEKVIKRDIDGVGWENLENTLLVIQDIRQGAYIIDIGKGLQAIPSNKNAGEIPYDKVLCYMPPVLPESLGDRTFLRAHGSVYPYIVGEMANGIASAELVISAAKAGMCGFFGAAGLSPANIEKNIQEIQRQLSGITCWGSNLIDTPQLPALQAAIVDVYLNLGVRIVSASAYIQLNPQIVRYAFRGIKQEANGTIIRPNHVIAKISRPEVAIHFMSPPPQSMLQDLVYKGLLTHDEAILAAIFPVAEDITVEADSAGHTDNRPLCALFPVILQLALECNKKYNYHQPLRVGAAGSLGTPAAVAAAFCMGAAYVLTGSINQASVESALSPEGKQLLSQAGIADYCMAPAADMFEIGVKVQILKKGLLYGVRAQQLYEIYRTYDSLEVIPASTRDKIEKQIFKTSIENIWEQTKQFFETRDPTQIERAQQDPKLRMALVFRWYLGLSSHWAITGDKERALDYQIWCGPAMGAFNSWVKGSFLEDLKERTVKQMGLNLLEGAAYLLRLEYLRGLGISMPYILFDYRPKKFI